MASHFIPIPNHTSQLTTNWFVTFCSRSCRRSPRSRRRRSANGPKLACLEPRQRASRSVGPKLAAEVRHEISRRAAKGETAYAIAKGLHIDRHTAAKYLQPSRPRVLCCRHYSRRCNGCLGREPIVDIPSCAAYFRLHCTCPPLGVERAFPTALHMSAFDPKRTSGGNV